MAKRENRIRPVAKKTKRKPVCKFGYLPTAVRTRIKDVDFIEQADTDMTPESLRHAYEYGGDDE